MPRKKPQLPVKLQRKIASLLRRTGIDPGRYRYRVGYRKLYNAAQGKAWEGDSDQWHEVLARGAALYVESCLDSGVTPSVEQFCAQRRVWVRAGAIDLNQPVSLYEEDGPPLADDDYQLFDP